ncbi:major facilitator superfamily domain-containing protein [Aspergillus karnatakaensis]|uniref:major facilitator superfamily domain-containing protein n=1 Tax=Aspergillus karnatakaensis TaxID=1810916 RepID=UPI003CCD76B9
MIGEKRPTASASAAGKDGQTGVSLENIPSVREPKPDTNAAAADAEARAGAEAQAQAGAEAEARDQNPTHRSKRRVSAILVALYLVLFTTALDQTVLSTSLPSIVSSLNSSSGYTWIGAAYLLSTASSGPIWARLSDIFGRKPALLLSVSLFGIASILAATSVSMRMLIAARALQGVGGGGIVQMVYITISDLFSIRRRALVFGGLGGVWAVAGSSGPVVGGLLAGAGGLGRGDGWRWCFWVNVPICVFAFGLLWGLLDVHNPRTGLREGVKAIDWVGTVSIVAVTVLLLLGMEFGGTVFPWDSATVICLIVFGVVMVGVFLVAEKKVAVYPLVPLGLFKSLDVTVAFVLSFAHGMVSFGIEYYLPLWFQSVKGASPLRSGVLTLPMMVTEAITDIISGVLLHRLGRYREITWVGVVLMTLGTGLFIRMNRTTDYGVIVAFEIVGGIGTALLFQTPVLAIQNSVRKADTASATATVGFMRNLATSFSIVLGGVVFRDGMESQQASLAAVGVDGEILRRVAGDAAAANVDIVKEIADRAVREAVQDAFAWSLRNMFIFYTAVCGVALVAGLFIKQKEMSKEHTETKTGIEEMAKREDGC